MSCSSPGSWSSSKRNVPPGSASTSFRRSVPKRAEARLLLEKRIVARDRAAELGRILLRDDRSGAACRRASTSASQPARPARGGRPARSSSVANTPTADTGARDLASRRARGADSERGAARAAPARRASARGRNSPCSPKELARDRRGRRRSSSRASRAAGARRRRARAACRRTRSRRRTSRSPCSIVSGSVGGVPPNVAIVSCELTARELATRARRESARE